MLVSFKSVLVATVLLACAGAAAAQTPSPLTPDQSKQIDAYLAQMKKMAKPAPSAGSVSAIPAAPVATAGDETVTTPDAKSIGDLLALAQPTAVPTGVAYGLSAGQGVQPAIPVSADLDRQTAQAIIAAYQNPNGGVADQVALNAAAAATDPALEERISLAETIFHVDGTEDLIRHFVATEHMKLIITEVANHIDFTKLSETDKYRLAAIAAVAQTELEDKIVRMNARMQAMNLSKPELMQLIVAYDIDAQRKLTQMRLHDDGKQDRAADLDVHIAQFQIVKAYEAGE